MKVDKRTCKDCKHSIEVKASINNWNNDMYCKKHKIYCSQGDSCYVFVKTDIAK